MERHDLPERWEWRNLGGVNGSKPACEFLDHLRVPVNEQERSKRPGPYPYYGANGQQGWIDHYIFNEELVLLAEDGGFFFDPIKPSSYRVSGKCWVNNHAHVLRPAPDVDPDWLNYTLAFTDYTQFIPEPIRPKLNQKNAKRIDIPVPPLSEQRRIVKRIEELTRRVEETRQLINDAIKDSSNLVPSFLGRLFDMAETKNWQKLKLADISTIIMGQSPKGSSYNRNNQGVPLLNGPTEFGIEHPTPLQWTTKPTKLCEKGDILFCVRGSTTGKMNWADQQYCLGRGLAAIRPRKKICISDFVFAFVQTQTAAILHSGEGGVFPNFNKGQLSAMEVPLPPLNEQYHMVKYLKNLQSKGGELKQLHIETETELSAFTPALLAKALQGEL